MSLTALTSHSPTGPSREATSRKASARLVVPVRSNGSLAVTSKWVAPEKYSPCLVGVPKRNGPHELISVSLSRSLSPATPLAKLNPLISPVMVRCLIPEAV